MTTEFGKILPLPPEVAAQIKSSVAIPSLGSVVLGLVENSIDAGSRRIDISIDTQRCSCTVEDDGIGIAPQEFRETGGLVRSCRMSSIKVHNQSSKIATRYLEAQQLGMLIWEAWAISRRRRFAIHSNCYLSPSSVSLVMYAHSPSLKTRFEAHTSPFTSAAFEWWTWN